MLTTGSAWPALRTIVPTSRDFMPPLTPTEKTTLSVTRSLWRTNGARHRRVLPVAERFVERHVRCSRPVDCQPRRRRDGDPTLFALCLDRPRPDDAEGYELVVVGPVEVQLRGSRALRAAQALGAAGALRARRARGSCGPRGPRGAGRPSGAGRHKILRLLLDERDHLARLRAVQTLNDALRICLAIREREPTSFDRAACRWLARYAVERRATLARLAVAVAALDLMREDADLAMELLERL